MACSFVNTKSKARQYPLNQPEHWTVKYPRWTLRLPEDIKEISISYIGVQPRGDCNRQRGVYNELSPHCVTDSQIKAVAAIESWLSHASQSDAPDLWEKFYVETGYDIPDTEVWVMYWTDAMKSTSALCKLDLERISRLCSTDIGLWRESFNVPKTRLETIYSGNDYQPGLASLKHSSQEPHTFTGYWGAARDRLPASSHTRFLPKLPAPTPNFTKNTAGQVFRGRNNDLILHIRSGQYWERCSAEEREAYETVLEPHLRQGMAYLENNPEKTGDFGLRFMRNLVSNQRLRDEENAIQSPPTKALSNIDRTYFGVGLNKRLETCSAGFFRSLSDLEHWAAHHKTHHKIFHGIHEHSSRFGKHSYKVRTWHEVSMLNPGEVQFEYVNCDSRTGLIPFVNIEMIRG